MMLNRANIEIKINDYLKAVNSIKLSAAPDDILTLINSLKREPLGSGPYPHVSMFEASNRIFSDLVILFGIRRLLSDPVISKIKLPFTRYSVRLGTEGGNDIEAGEDEPRLIGEAFSVAHSFFQTKKSSAINRLRSREADYRLIIFNSDAVNDPVHYLEISQQSMLYLPVDIWTERNRL